jgi:hypothetical protein
MATLKAWAKPILVVVVVLAVIQIVANKVPAFGKFADNYLGLNATGATV